MSTNRFELDNTSLDNRLDKVAAWLLVALFFFMTGSRSIPAVLSALLLTYFVLTGNLSAKIRFALQNRLSQSFLLLLGVIVVLGVPRTISFADYVDSAKAYYPMLTAPLFMWYLRDPKVRTRCIYAFALGVSITVALIFIDVAWPLSFAKSNVNNDNVQLHVIFLNHITQGVLLAMLTVVCAWIHKTDNRNHIRYLALGMLVASLIANFGLSTGRTGYVASLVSIPFLCAVYLRGKYIALGLVAMVVGLGALLSMPDNLATERLKVTAQEITDYLHGKHSEEAIIGNSAGTRLLQSQNGLSAAMERPLLGWGTGAFETAFFSRPNTEQYRAIPMEHPHNQYVLQFVENGAIGLLALLLVFLLPTLKVLSNNCTAPVPYKMIWLALLACTATHCMFQTAFFVVSDRNIHPFILSALYMMFHMGFINDSKSA